MTQMRIKAGELAQIINIHLAEKGCKWASARTVEQFASGYIEFRGVKGEAMGRMDFRLEPGTEYIEDLAALHVQGINRLILANHVSDVLEAARTEGGCAECGWSLPTHDIDCPVYAARTEGGAR